MSHSQSLCRFLRQEAKGDILCLQETHATSPNVQKRLDMQLQAQQSIWTQHCGIISCNPSINIEHIFSSPDGRAILCQVSHINTHFPSFTLMNVYAPAQYRERYQFYAYLLSLEYFHPILSDINATHLLTDKIPSIIVGDFNYNFQHYPHSSIL